MELSSRNTSPQRNNSKVFFCIFGFNASIEELTPVKYETVKGYRKLSFSMKRWITFAVIFLSTKMRQCTCLDSLQPKVLSEKHSSKLFGQWKKSERFSLYPNDWKICKSSYNLGDIYPIFTASESADFTFQIFSSTAEVKESTISMPYHFGRGRLNIKEKVMHKKI